VNRAQGQLVTWSGGAPGTYVQIGGQSAITNGSVTVSSTFQCLAAIGDGQFMIPSWITLTLPPNTNGALHISNVVYGPTFSAAHLDFGYTLLESLSDKVVTYQ
jgi:hypothetical protein